MKKVLYNLLVLCGLFGLWGCEETSQDESKITYYVNFEMNGDALTQVPVGTTFTDPGVVATEGDEDVTSSVDVKSDVDANKIGVYSIVYSAVNQDGFPSSVERTVVVYNPEVKVDASGSYTENSKTSYRTASGKTANFKGDFSVVVKQYAPGVFSVSDFLGGWYDQGSAYGATYALKGYFKLNPDNTIEPISSFLEGWGDSMESLKDGKYDPEKGQIVWTVTYANMLFYIEMNK